MRVAKAFIPLDKNLCFFPLFWASSTATNSIKAWFNILGQQGYCTVHTVFKNLRLCTNIYSEW